MGNTQKTIGDSSLDLGVLKELTQNLSSLVDKLMNERDRWRIEHPDAKGLQIIEPTKFLEDYLKSYGYGEDYLLLARMVSPPYENSTLMRNHRLLYPNPESTPE